MSRYSLLAPDEPLDSPSDEHANIGIGESQAVQDMDAVLAERLQLEELSIQDDTTAALALQYEEYASKAPKVSSAEKNRQDKDSSLAEALQLSEYDIQPATTSSAQQQYRSVFPSGPKLLSTPGTKLRCGLYAIMLSYANQYSSRTIQPTLESLLAVVNSVRYRSIVSRPQIPSSAHEAGLMAPATKHILTKDKKNKKTGDDIHNFLQNDRYFSPDQLDLLLRFWGEQNGLRLRLGYVHHGEAKLLSRGQADETGDVVWIHFNPKGAGHYSGLATKKASNLSSAARK